MSWQRAGLVLHPYEWWRAAEAQAQEDLTRACMLMPCQWIIAPSAFSFGVLWVQVNALRLPIEPN